MLTIVKVAADWNVAIRAVSARIRNEHADRAPQEELSQPVNTDPGFAVAASESGVLSAKEAAQVAPQYIPAGSLVTVPDPVPARETDSVSKKGIATKFALTALFWERER